MAFQLLDAYGRPIKPNELRQEQASPLTRAVRRPEAMHPASGLTPVRLANILRESIDGDPEPYLALAEEWGVPADDLRGHRFTMSFPPVPSAVVMRVALPERSGEP